MHDHFYKQELMGYAREGGGERCEGKEKGEGEGERCVEESRGGKGEGEGGVRRG